MSDENKTEGVLQEIPPPTKPEAIPGESRPRRRKKTAWDNVSPRQQLLINEVLSGNTLEKAGLAIKLHEDPEKARKKAHNMLQQPKVYMALQERLNYMYPDLSKKVAQKLKFLLDQPIKVEKDQPGLSVKEFLEVAKYLKDVQGWDSPKKSHHLRATVTNYKFPGEK